MDLYYIVVFFIFGICLGSFYNVVAYRLPNGMSLIKPPSHCPKCNNRLSLLELVPIFSYLFQGGKCKNCKCHIPMFYPIFETFTGLLFVLTYKLFGLDISTYIALLFISMILIIVLSDYLYMIISDEVLIFTYIAIFILKVIEGGISVIPSLLINSLIPFTFLFLLKLIADKMFKKESLGGGDIKLMLVYGLTLGWDVSLFSVFLAAFIALPVSLILIKKLKNHELPFGPFLGVAALICLFFKIDTAFLLKLMGL